MSLTTCINSFSWQSEQVFSERRANSHRNPGPVVIVVRLEYVKKAHLTSDFMKKISLGGARTHKKNKKMMKAYEDLEARILPSNI